MSEFLYYFGAWQQAGHYVWTPSGRSQLYGLPYPYRLPDAGTLDGCKLFLPPKDVPGTWELTLVISDVPYTVLAWWDRTFDTRPNTNCAIVASGHEAAGDVWKRFEVAFPKFAAALPNPLLRSVDSGKAQP